ncbi:MAG: FAD-binding protein, partial [Saprospiraceae bacterium]|nr:FAD-binding protein [Saprospiraceae bacterium]
MKETEIRLSPSDAHNSEAIRLAAAQKLDLPLESIADVQIVRRSVDARGRDAVFQLRVAVFT